MTDFHLLILICLVNLVLYQKPVLGFATATLNEGTLARFSAITTIVIATFLLTFVFLLLADLVSVHLVKAVAALVLVVNAAALYFIDTYQVLLDRSMMGNVFNTRYSEAASYADPDMLAYVLLLGVVPAVAIACIRITRLPRLRLAAYSSIVVLVCALALYANSRAWLWVDNHGKQLGGLVLPWSYVGNSARHFMTQRAENRRFRPLPDASVAPGKAVVVLVIGETARAQNFSLYGYDRETNPQLRQLGVLALPAEACSTYTTASLRCMLTHDESDGDDYEPLPTYLERLGVDVLWHSRNWGEPRLDIENYRKASELRAACSREDCDYDGVLLTGVEDFIRSSTKDKIFIALHTKGSHGPEYFAQYPPQFQAFTPVCESANPNECTHEALVNAYDNSILYTDYLIAEVIRVLQSIDTHETTLIYMSDHGESLGEFGLYLHGTPLLLAPAYQTKVPMLVWRAETATPPDVNTPVLVNSGGGGPYGQSVVFHSALGALGIQSAVYRNELDIHLQAAHH